MTPSDQHEAERREDTLTLDEALDVVEDMCGNEECNALKPSGYHATPLSKFASKIYTIIHAHRKQCSTPHTEWLLKKPNDPSRE